MHPRYCLSQEIFEREQEKIFRKAWLFAGLKTLLPKNHSFITRKIAGIPVVIQNFDGQLRAFENICLHRNALLQTAPAGCRPLVCAYHAWRYAADGTVAHIPDCETVYGFGPQQRARMKLREFALRAVGNVLFINLDAEPLPLQAQFSEEFLALLESSSSAYDTEVMVTSLDCRFNWKLGYENLRDANHPRFVYPKSLGKTVSFTPRIDAAMNREADTPLADTGAAALRREMRRFSFGGADAPIPALQHFAWHALVERWGTDDVYYNWLAFPNLHIASANGGHDTHIGNYCMVGAMGFLAGGVRVEDDVALHPRATIAKGVTLGAGCTVGIGSVVVKNVAPRVTVFGNPARAIYS